MNETFEFLKKITQVNYVSTIDNGRPTCRPFGDPVLFDGKIYALTNKQKDVSKQLSKDSHACIVAYDGEDKWIRIHCELVDDSNNLQAKQAIIDEFDWAEEAGYTLDNPDFQILYIANATAVVYDSDGTAYNEYHF